MLVISKGWIEEEALMPLCSEDGLQNSATGGTSKHGDRVLIYGVFHLLSSLIFVHPDNKSLVTSTSLRSCSAHQDCFVVALWQRLQTQCKQGSYAYQVTLVSGRVGGDCADSRGPDKSVGLSGCQCILLALINDVHRSEVSSQMRTPARRSIWAASIFKH